MNETLIKIKIKFTIKIKIAYKYTEFCKIKSNYDIYLIVKEGKNI
jgi:uncharacterized protein (DUF111 family)